MRVDRVPLEAALGVQFVAQRGLIDRCRRPWLRDSSDLESSDTSCAVGAGLAVGHDHVGVQVRVAAPRRFVLVGDRHQARQPLQVLVAGARVVHPGVAGVLVQVGHRGVDGPGWAAGDDFFGDVVGERSQQRHAFGRGERQVEAVHAVVGERAAPGAVGRDPVIEPDARPPSVSANAALQLRIRPGRSACADEAVVADDQPRRGRGCRPPSSTPPAHRWRVCRSIAACSAASAVSL